MSVLRIARTLIRRSPATVAINSRAAASAVVPTRCAYLADRARSWRPFDRQRPNSSLTSRPPSPTDRGRTPQRAPMSRASNRRPLAAGNEPSASASRSILSNRGPSSSVTIAADVRESRRRTSDGKRRWVTAHVKTVPCPVAGCHERLSRPARAARVLGRVDPRAAVVATLQTQLADRGAKRSTGPPSRRWAEPAVAFGVGASHGHPRIRSRMAMLPSPKSPQPVTTPILASATWRAGLAAQLAHRLDDVVHAEHVRLREQPAVGVDGQAPPSSMRAVRDERAALAARAEAGLLELLQHLEREAVVDLGEVDVVGPDAGHRERLGARRGEADRRRGRRGCGCRRPGYGCAVGDAADAHGRLAAGRAPRSAVVTTTAAPRRRSRGSSRAAGTARSIIGDAR